MSDFRKDMSWVMACIPWERNLGEYVFGAYSCYNWVFLRGAVLHLFRSVRRRAELQTP